MCMWKRHGSKVRGTVSNKAMGRPGRCAGGSLPPRQSLLNEGRRQGSTLWGRCLGDGMLWVGPLPPGNQGRPFTAEGSVNPGVPG